MIVELLTMRGLAPDSESRERILGCRQAEVLERWWTAALQVTSAEQLFED